MADKIYKYKNIKSGAVISVNNSEITGSNWELVEVSEVSDDKDASTAPKKGAVKK